MIENKIIFKYESQFYISIISIESVFRRVVHNTTVDSEWHNFILNIKL